MSVKDTPEYDKAVKLARLTIPKGWRGPRDSDILVNLKEISPELHQQLLQERADKRHLASLTKLKFEEMAEGLAEDLVAAAQALLKHAKDGNASAFAVAHDRAIGTPQQHLDVTTQGSNCLLYTSPSPRDS